MDKWTNGRGLAINNGSERPGPGQVAFSFASLRFARVPGCALARPWPNRGTIICCKVQASRDWPLAHPLSPNRVVARRQCRHTNPPTDRVRVFPRHLHPLHAPPPLPSPPSDPDVRLGDIWRLLCSSRSGATCRCHKSHAQPSLDPLGSHRSATQQTCSRTAMLRLEVADGTSRVRGG